MGPLFFRNKPDSLTSLRIAHFKLVEALGQVNSHYGIPLFFQMANMFFVLLIYSYSIIRIYVFQEYIETPTNSTMDPNMGTIFPQNSNQFQNIEYDSTFQAFNALGHFSWFFYQMFRLLVIIFIIDFLTQRKKEILSILNR